MQRVSTHDTPRHGLVLASSLCFGFFRIIHQRVLVSVCRLPLSTKHVGRRICPGYIETPMTQTLRQGRHAEPGAIGDRIREQHKLGR